jgi:hypothetical protein
MKRKQDQIRYEGDQACDLQARDDKLMKQLYDVDFMPQKLVKEEVKSDASIFETHVYHPKTGTLEDWDGDKLARITHSASLRNLDNLHHF